jgi:hypothetical protein
VSQGCCERGNVKNRCVTVRGVAYGESYGGHNSIVRISHVQMCQTS